MIEVPRRTVKGGTAASVPFSEVSDTLDNRCAAAKEMELSGDHLAESGCVGKGLGKPNRVEESEICIFRLRIREGVAVYQFKFPVVLESYTTAGIGAEGPDAIAMAMGLKDKFGIIDDICNGVIECSVQFQADTHIDGSEIIYDARLIGEVPEPVGPLSAGADENGGSVESLNGIILPAFHMDLIFSRMYRIYVTLQYEIGTFQHGAQVIDKLFPVIRSPVPLLGSDKFHILFQGNRLPFCNFTIVGKGDLFAERKTGEDRFDMGNDIQCLTFVELEFIKVEAYPVMEIQLPVVEKAARGIFVAVKHGDALYPQSFQL